MAQKPRLMDFVEKKSTVLATLAFSVLVLLGVEMVIYIAAASHAGEQSRVEVKDREGFLVYQSPGHSVEHLDRWYFERKFGNLDNYDVQVKTVSKPFPVRAWVSAAVGVPIVLLLLISYLVKVYMVLLHGSEPQSNDGYPVPYSKQHPFTAWTHFLSSHSIFYLGAFIGIGALTFWMVPNFLADLLDSSLNLLRESKWFILGPALFIAAFAAWVVYLRYRLSRRMMDHQFTLERYRIDRQVPPPEQIASDRVETMNKQLEA